MSYDLHLTRWSAILFWFAVMTVLLCLCEPLALLFSDAPIALAKGTEVWSSSLNALPATDVAFILMVLLAPQCAWLVAVIQVAYLAGNYRRGIVFDRRNAGRFLRIGIALAVMGVLHMLVMPFIGYWVFHRGLCPWLPDMPFLAIAEPDLMMSGIFFFVLGKIMQRGAELQESEDLTV